MKLIWRHMYPYKMRSGYFVRARSTCVICSHYFWALEQFTRISNAATYGNHPSHQEISESLFALSVYRTADNRRDFVTAQTVIKRMITEISADLAFPAPHHTR